MAMSETTVGQYRKTRKALEQNRIAPALRHVEEAGLVTRSPFLRDSRAAFRGIRSRSSRWRGVYLSQCSADFLRPWRLRIELQRALKTVSRLRYFLCLLVDQPQMIVVGGVLRRLFHGFLQQGKRGVVAAHFVVSPRERIGGVRRLRHTVVRNLRE